MIDPELRPPEELTSAIKAMILGICLGVGGVILIIAIIILVLWCLKSKRREKERFERTASMRSSLNNLSKINGSLRGTKSTLSMMSVGASRRRLNELDQRSMDSSLTTKHSRDSAVSNGTSVHSVHSVSSGMDIADRTPVPQVAVEAPTAATFSKGGARPKDVAPPSSRPGGGRQVHSLRPDRSAAGLRAQIQAGAGAAATLPAARGASENPGRSWVRKGLKEKERKNQEGTNSRENPPQEIELEDDDEERGQYAENSDNDSVDKEDFDSDSTFDDHEDDENHRGNEEDLDSKDMRYHMNRSNERLVERPWEPSGDGKRYGPGPLPPKPHPTQASADSDASDYLPNPNKPKSLSSFLDPASIPPAKRALLPPLSSSRDNLSSPPHDPRQLPSSNGATGYGPRPAPRPKPLPPTRQIPSTDHDYKNEPPYNNRPPPFYDSVYEGSNRGGSSNGGSQGFPLYDPVYDPSTDNSRSTNRYEPVEFNQPPDTDYMPRPLNSNLGRDRLGPPPPVPLQPSHQPSLPRAAAPRHHLPLESDIDSYMSDHGGQSLPRKPNPPSSIYSEDSVGSSRFTDTLPPKPGAPPSTPYHSSGSQAPYTPHYLPPQPRANSRENLTQPPPYSTMPKEREDHRSRHGSRDRGLDYAGALGSQDRPLPSSRHGSRERLDELPPPYSPGDGNLSSQPRGIRGSQNDILYLNQGSRPKLNESIETEI